MPRLANRCRRAFTLMEIALVLAIIVAVAAMAAPAYIGTLKRERVRKAAASVAADWTRTRSMAIEKGETQLWVCTIATGSYSAASYTTNNGVTNGDVANMVGQTGDTGANADASFGQSLPEGVSITEVSVTDADSLVTMSLTTTSGESGAATLLFFPDGTSSSARIALKGEGEITMAVVINGMAGTVRVMPVESSQ